MYNDDFLRWIRDLSDPTRQLSELASVGPAAQVAGVVASVNQAHLRLAREAAAAPALQLGQLARRVAEDHAQIVADAARAPALEVEKMLRQIRADQARQIQQMVNVPALEAARAARWWTDLVQSYTVPTGAWSDFLRTLRTATPGADPAAFSEAEDAITGLAPEGGTDIDLTSWVLRLSATEQLRVLRVTLLVLGAVSIIGADFAGEEVSPVVRDGIVLLLALVELIEVVIGMRAKHSRN
jgi:hypothetical protein